MLLKSGHHAVSVAKRKVDRLYYRRLQIRLLNGRCVTGGWTMLQTDTAPPHDEMFSTVIPCDPPINLATLEAANNIV